MFDVASQSGWQEGWKEGKEGGEVREAPLYDCNKVGPSVAEVVCRKERVDP